MKIQTLDGEETTRPTSLKVRQAVMNMVQMEIQGAVVADLFAGSGAVGLEFLSRGAERVYFIEKERQAFLTLKKNCETAENRLKSDRHIVWRQKKVEQFFEDDALKFDLIWADPPYRLVPNEIKVWGEKIAAFLNPRGLFLLECDAQSKSEVLSLLGQQIDLVLEKDKEYGETVILGWRLKA